MSRNIKYEINNLFTEHKKEAERAKIIAVNRAGKSAVVAGVKFIRQTYRIKASILKAAYKLYKANKNSKVFQMVAKHKPLALAKYGSPRETKKGVSVTVKKGNRKTYPGTFKATMNSGHTGIYKRKNKWTMKTRPGKKTKHNQKIKELYGPSAEQLLSSKETFKEMEKTFLSKIGDEFRRALKFAKK